MTVRARRRLSVPASILTFVLMTAVSAAVAMSLLILADPRTQAFWGGRLAELGSTVRALLPW